MPDLRLIVVGGAAVVLTAIVRPGLLAVVATAVVIRLAPVAQRFRLGIPAMVLAWIVSGYLSRSHVGLSPMGS